MTSQLNVDTILDKAGSGGSNVKMANTSTYVSDGGATTQNTVQGLVKSWVNHDQATVNDSHNIGSVTDNGSGDYGTNFTNNMSNANYSAGGLGVHDGGSYTRIQTIDHDDPFTTSEATINVQDTNGTQADAEPLCTLYVGDLA